MNYSRTDLSKLDENAPTSKRRKRSRSESER